jgi:PRC-barrel domain
MAVVLGVGDAQVNDQPRETRVARRDPGYRYSGKGGMAMLNESDLRASVSRDVVDRDGKSVGYVETIFNDRTTGKPEWIGVLIGTLRRRHVLVPVSGAQKADGGVLVPWTKDEVESAPDYGGMDRDVSDEMEREAYRHYGMEPDTAQ